MMFRQLPSGFVAALAVGLVLPRTVGAQSPDAAAFQRLLADRGPAVVTIKFVLKISVPGGDESENQEVDTEVSGVLIDPKGVVVCSNALMGAFTSVINRFAEEFTGQINATPTDLKVLIGDDTEGKEAELIARDSELDLAWIRIKEPGDKPLPHIDLSGGAKPSLGQPLLAVRRMSKHFARTAVVASGHVGGITSKPRDFYIPTGDVRTAVGLPVFTADGRPVGVVILEVPDPESMEFSFATIVNTLRDLDQLFAGVILPAEEVMKATKRALESAADK